MEIEMQKKALRREMKALRGQVAKEAYLQYEQAGAELFFQEVPVSAYDAFFLYIPFGSEISTWAIINRLWRQKRRLAVPRVRTEEAAPVMEFCQIAGTGALEKGAFGILEPKQGQAPCIPRKGEQICMLVPGLAFSADGGRLGYGGGYYDAYLKKYEACGITAVGFCYDFQLLPRLPRLPHDVLADRVLAVDVCNRGNRQDSS